MITSKTNEQAFESLIERALVGSTKEERVAFGLNDVQKQNPGKEQYYWGEPKDFNKTYALDERRLWAFLESTQRGVLDEYQGRDLRVELSKQLSKKIATFGIIEVLKKGIEINNIHIDVFYPQPSAADSEISHRKYASNQFSITRQQTFSLSNSRLEIDMVLFVNGIPIFTIELKNPWTHQTARFDGQKQYRSTERDPKEPLLQFGRCLAHFTMDKNEVYFTTRLNLDKTFFMPFNKGLANGQGAGNPVNMAGGYKTSYMWEQVFQKDNVADIIMNYVLFDYGEAKTQKKVAHVMKNAKVLIFPRYHQMDVVNKLVSDVSTSGVGKTYLIEHSAGSGKSNSLTWLAFKLIKACPSSTQAVRAKSVDETLYASAIVVTDRRILDKQITDNIKAFGQTERILAHADTSSDLKTAIEDGKRIIITTIQKFPYICNAISDVSNHNFAIIIDEAHSSQSGISADKLNATMQKDSDANGGDTDALLAQLMRERKMSSNCSYFAFTATPKKETLERFGTKDSEGKFHPFHLYSMKQAIEEGFILDVLSNYTTYQSYYELAKSIEDNPEFNNDKAQKALRKAVEREPKTIKTKAEEMLKHFDSKVYRNHKLKGKAKGMVVTKDIECAIMYYQALQELAIERKLPYKILIAFSGEKKLGSKEYTEAGLNGFPDTQTPEKFEEDEYRLLVVANKYLTGFDQPKLCTMYIDKPLDGVLAVQALSRLNRAAPALGKLSEDLFVLDFYNTKDEMKESFDPFYTSTMLSEATDVNILHELKETLLGFDVFDMDQVNVFIASYIRGDDAELWSSITDTAAQRFNHEIDWPENGKADFKMKCKQFVKVYSKVAAIIDFEVPDWEKLYWFLRYLIPDLNVKNPEDDRMRDLLDSVDLNTYGLRRTALNETVALDASGTTMEPLKSNMAGAGEKDTSKLPLDQILNDFNEKWFKGWEATPEDQKAKIVSITKAVTEDERYKSLVIGNTDKEEVERIMPSIIDEAIRLKRKGDMSLYRAYQNDASFKSHFREMISRMLAFSLTSTAFDYPSFEEKVMVAAEPGK